MQPASVAWREWLIEHPSRSGRNRFSPGRHAAERVVIRASLRGRRRRCAPAARPRAGRAPARPPRWSASSSPPARAAAAAARRARRELAQLLQPRRHPVELAPALELRERGAQRRVELQGGLAAAPLVEVEPRAQREQLARERDVARGQQRGEALLRAQRGLAPDLLARRAQLARLGPAAVGDLLAGAVADARRERMARRGLAAVRVRGRDPVRVQRGLEHGERLRHRLRRPPARASPRGSASGSAPITEIAGDVDGRGVLLRRARPRRPRARRGGAACR